MMNGPTSAKLATLALGFGLVLGGCASPASIGPGTPDSQIIARLGQPTARYTLPDGARRLQYSLEPLGRQVYNVDLDAQGRAARVEQALDETLFPQRIATDRWTRQDVLREYGQPMRIMTVHSFDGEIWLWRYLDVIAGPRLLYIEMDRGNVVRGYSTVDDRSDFDRSPR